jgi:ferritin-like metal-binding protein YciE
MTLMSLEDAFVHELRDVLHAERQITKALPRMARKASDPQLRSAFDQHLRETEEQIRRLEQVFESLGEKVKAKKCEGVEGLLDEGKQVLKEDAEANVRDALLIAAAQKVEHYEIATYGTLCTWSKQLGHRSEVTELLKRNLSEEKQTDELLTQIARRVNAQAGARVPASAV